MTMATRERDGGAEGGAVDLWAMAAELERQFAGYKQRFPETRSSCVDDDDDVVAVADDDDAGGALQLADGGCGASSGEEDEETEAGGGVRGRMYEAYTRRRDERLRSVWRARMERKEAEVMALWARLRGGGPTTANDDDDGCTAGEEAEEDGGEKRRSSDVAAPGRVPGKKHARTRRSFSSANLVNNSRSRPDVGLRRALSQEPLPPASAAAAEGASKKLGGAAPKRKALAGSKGGSVRGGRGSVGQAGPKPPRGGLPRRCGSGGVEAVALPSCSGEQAAASDRDEAQKASSSPMPFVRSGDDDGNGNTGIETARAASPESECDSEVVDGAAANGITVRDAVVDVADKRDAEEIIAVQSAEPEAKLGNGEITSDSETEPSYVFIKKKDGQATRLSDALAGSDAEARLDGKNCTGDADQATTAADADMAKTNAGEAAALEGESSDGLSSFSGTGRSGRDSAPNSAPSSSSRSQSIERLLEEDAALLRKKRQHQRASGGRRSVQAAASTPPSARSTGASGAARATSPRGTGVGFKKRFLSFGKKNRGGRDDGAAVIDCTSPASPADSGSGSARRRCRTADPIRPRMLGSSSDAAASDDTEHGYAASPQACSLQSLVAASPAKSELSEMVPQEKSPKSHRSFFSFRSFNCGRG